MNYWKMFGGVAALVLVTSVASAHVVVEPHESLAGEVTNYVVRIPSHLDATTIAVELEVPQGVEILSVAKTSGRNEIIRSPSGVTIIKWATKIPADERGEVSFTARNPSFSTELNWKAHQFYDNGVTINWIDPRGGKQPASITKINDPSGSKKDK